jgi:methyltransferase-like protein
MSNDFAYDKVRYPAQVYPKLHPSRLAAIARLHGVPVASPKACRLLEVGCGDGLTLLTQAMAYPDSQFVGVDMSHAAIARGDAIRAKLGLDNLTLVAADLLSWDPGEVPFDFIIAHGFYSWVPHAVRERLLALCNQAMAPTAIACITYNALPGCHMRRMLWDMLKFHSAFIEDPVERVERAREFLDLLKSGLPENSLYATTMTGEIDDLSDRLDPNVLFHDDLAEINDPCTLDQFVRHASEHDLTFVAEANYHEMSPRTAHERIRPLLEQMARDDLVAKEQYLDFFTGRRFRQTLLCRRDAAPNPSLDPTVIGTLWLASDLQPDRGGPDNEGRQQFSLRSSGSVVTDNAVIQTMLTECAALYPQSRCVADLAGAALSVTVGADVRMQELEKICQFFARAFEVGIVELHCDGPRFAGRPSLRPSASPLARLQVEAGESVVTSLRPSTLTLDDIVSRSLLLALDGSRDRAATVAFLTAQMDRIQSDDDAGGSHLPGPSELEAHLDANLEKMAQLGLLLEDEA